MNTRYYTPELTCWANDNDALVPEIWAREALRVVMSNMVMGSLVNRDYSDEVKEHGDVVNAHRPADFSGTRVTDSDDTVDQDAVSTNVPVPLDQHVIVPFIIKDGEMSKALPDLVEYYLEPAAREVAEKVDQILCGQAVRLATYEEGRLTEMDSSNASGFVLDANTRLTINRCPKMGRNLVLGPRAEKATLGATLFVSTEQRGDDGTALRTASLGTVYGMDAFMDQNMSYVAVGDAQVSTGATDNAEAAGDTVVETTVAASAADLKAGCYVVFGGEGKPYRISSIANDPIDITLTEGLRDPVGAAAAVTVYRTGEVNGTTFVSGWVKDVSVDGHDAGKGPQLGQWVTFGTGANSHSYTVIAVTETTTTQSEILLDRPLDTALTTGDDVFYGPAGGMNMAFHRDALALVSRPLATVPADTGARSFVASFDGLAMRVTMQYDRTKRGMGVSFDLLCGVAVLDNRFAVVLYS